MEPKPLKEITKDYVHWGDLISKLAVFCHAKRIVEIGVQYADTTIHLCRAAKKVKGFVHGFDVFGPLPDTAYEEKSYGKLSKCLDRLKLHKKFFQLHQMDTRTDEFKEKINDLYKEKGIDLAFIDACHSYNGALNDFKIIYPFLSRTGIVVFHDTYSHVGLRKLNIDLRTKYYDGTFDVIELPFGKSVKRTGLTILVKRSFMDTNCGIINTSHDPEMKPEDIYEYENNYLLNEIKSSKLENK
jgi:predicted O-methyltransferase YrrM